MNVEKSKVEIYTRPGCGYCEAARKFFTKRSVDFEEYDVYRELHRKQELWQRTEGRTYPQIFVNDQPVGGFTDFIQLANTETEKRS